MITKKFPEFSKEVKRLKETGGGAQAVCEVMEMYEKIAVNEERLTAICNLILKKGYAKEDILDLDYTEEEYQKASEKLLVVK